MSEKPKILCLGEADDHLPEAFRQLEQDFEMIEVSSLFRALSLLHRGVFAGVIIPADSFRQSLQLANRLRNERILKEMPDGVALLDNENTIIWANDRVVDWSGHESVAGMNFYTVLGSPEILGPDFCPFHSALANGRPTNSTLRSGENRYFQVHAAPVHETHCPPQNLIVTVRDVSSEMLQQQKLEAIHKAGNELADLTTEEIFNMQVEDRIELLKSNIIHYTQDLLNFDVVEVRLLDQKSSLLVPLLSVGIMGEAMGRPLYARPQNNGVTGFVAATGKSYLCEDTTEDPLYLEGCANAKSSLTVPLILHDQVIGTFNVESPEPRAFSESDLQFLEIFSRDLAVALNTLELLVAQQANTAQASVEAIHSVVALPVDEILNDAVNVMERYIGHEPSVVERLERILQNARDIKQMIQKVGQKMTPTQAMPTSVQVEQRPKLESRRVLVVDADDKVRQQAHKLLERYGCIVETAHTGGEAVFMVRNCGSSNEYDVIIADVSLPDYTGYDLLIKLKELMDHVPLALMTGFGYDPQHSIVKARQAGLAADAILYKPFRLDQLLETVEKMVTASSEVSPT